MPLEECLQHMQECLHAVVECECSQRMKRGILASHQYLECPKALVQCEFCETRGIRRGLLHEHLERCAASAQISHMKRMHDMIQVLSEQVIGLQAQLSSVRAVGEWQIHLPNQILALPIGDGGYWTSHVHGIWLNIFPKGVEATGTHISVFVCPSMPITAEIHITIGDSYKMVQHSWTETLLSRPASTSEHFLGWCEFMTIDEVENTDSSEVYLPVVATPGILSTNLPECTAVPWWIKPTATL